MMPPDPASVVRWGSSVGGSEYNRTNRPPRFMDGSRRAGAAATSAAVVGATVVGATVGTAPPGLLGVGAGAAFSNEVTGGRVGIGVAGVGAEPADSWEAVRAVGRGESAGSAGAASGEVEQAIRNIAPRTRNISRRMPIL
jgi:hypothetical protein